MSGEENRNRIVKHHARKTAVQEYRDLVTPFAMAHWREHGFVTVDDLRAATEPPANVGDRSMGGVLSVYDGWVPFDHIRSERGINNGKFIAMFRYDPEEAAKIAAQKHAKAKATRAANKARAA
jgi:hypothetical protein